MFKLKERVPGIIRTLREKFGREVLKRRILRILEENNVYDGILEEFGVHIHSDKLKKKFLGIFQNEEQLIEFLQKTENRFFLNLINSENLLVILNLWDTKNSLERLINKLDKNFSYLSVFIFSETIKEIIKRVPNDEVKVTLRNFFENKIFRSGEMTKFFFFTENEFFRKHPDYFYYLVKYHKKKLLKCWKLLVTAIDLGVNTDFIKIKRLEELEEGENFENFIKKLERIHYKILNILSKKDVSIINKLSKIREKERKIGKKIISKMVNNLIDYYIYILDRKINIRLREFVKAYLGIKERSKLKCVNNTLVIETLKMAVSTPYNKNQIKGILRGYLLGKFDSPLSINNLNQYDTEANRGWLDEFLNDEQKGIWLSENRKTYKIPTLDGEKEIEVYIENDPLRILMMGNWVKDSCLDFNHPIKNYWSAIANAVDVNKRVIYIIDKENGNILGRCLIVFGNDRKISRFRLYFGKTLSAYQQLIYSELDEIIDRYVAEIAKQMNVGLNGSAEKIVKIESDKWYYDGIKEVYENLLDK